MERSAWPKNLSSSRKRAITELLHDQNPTKKLGHLFDAHSRTGNDTRQPLFAEHLVVVNALGSFSNALSLSSGAQSDEVVQVLSNACVRSELCLGGTCKKYFRCAHQMDQGCQAAKWVDRTLYDPRFFRIACQDRHTCKKLILKSPPLIVDSPSARDDSIPLSFNTSLFAEQDDENNPIFFDFLSVNQEQKLPGDDVVNPPPGHSHDRQ
ncbi:uncharacterized protein LOC115677041 [Syzygium oleosum]|uniref:uncharacterized protein LOC115677041 n=1 Tax=Syzygium oleosum TaxID=219896 RepID=UPI0011D1EFC0|nr:uncharacterized protein LOC115677041 [Syzygium oleosum]